MVVPSSFRSPPVERPSIVCRSCALFAVLIGILLWKRLLQEETDVTHFEFLAEDGMTKNSKDASLLDCSDVLSDARLGMSDFFSADNIRNQVDKIYAAYLTNYDPPFWISQHVDDKDIVNTGSDSDLEEQSTILVNILKANRGGDVVFYDLDDAGWFSLLAASKPGYRVQIYYPTNQTNSFRLCESIRLNQWDLPGSSRENISPRIQIIVTGYLDLPSLGEKNSLILLKLHLFDQNVGQSDLRLVEHGAAQYLWIEYRGLGTLETIIRRIDQSGNYEPFWPKPSANGLFIEPTSCRRGCHLWWKRKDFQPP